MATTTFLSCSPNFQNEIDYKLVYDVSSVENPNTVVTHSTSTKRFVSFRFSMFRFFPDQFYLTSSEKWCELWNVEKKYWAHAET